MMSVFLPLACIRKSGRYAHLMLLLHILLCFKHMCIVRGRCSCAASRTGAYFN